MSAKSDPHVVLLFYAHLKIKHDTSMCSTHLAPRLLLLILMIILILNFIATTRTVQNNNNNNKVARLMGDGGMREQVCDNYIF